MGGQQFFGNSGCNLAVGHQNPEFLVKFIRRVWFFRGTNFRDQSVQPSADRRV